MQTTEVKISSQGARLTGDLSLPSGARGLVLFAHGSGSSRFSRRNRYVASVFIDSGLATLLMDLLTPEEEQRDLMTREHRFDIELLARRVMDAHGWATESTTLPVGYIGSSTGAAAALLAAARGHRPVAAVVSRGGRPDLVGAELARVKAPTLLIVGSLDHQVLKLNRQAQSWMQCKNELAEVPGATHLFEEPGTLQQAARLAGDWLGRYLPPQNPLG